jgi:hypothetical protein
MELWKGERAGTNRLGLERMNKCVSFRPFSIFHIQASEKFEL